MKVIGMVPIVENRLYSIVYDDAEDGVFDLLFEQWSDVNYLVEFFSRHTEYTENKFWKGMDNDPERAALSVIEDASELEPCLIELAENANEEEHPDLDDFFDYLEGDYKYVIRHVSMKGYGMKNPSLIRLYAIKMETNVYIIVYGGIKLKKTIQDSPILKDEVLRRINAVMLFMKENGIIDKEDI